MFSAKQILCKNSLFQEEDLRKLLDELSTELDGKMDRMELEPLKDWLEKRLKALAARIKVGAGDVNEDEAAGLKKQMLQHFHCISCDRPIDMPPQAYVEVALFHSFQLSNTVSYPLFRRCD